MRRVRQITSTVTLSQPESKGYQSITVRTHMRQLARKDDPPALPDDLRIELTRLDGTMRALVIDSATLQFRDASVPGGSMSSKSVDADALVTRLKLVGVQAETAELNAEMQLAMTQVQHAVTIPPIQQISSGTLFSGTTSSSGGSTRDLPWVDFMPLIVSALVWIIGCIRIARRPFVSRVAV